MEADKEPSTAPTGRIEDSETSALSKMTQEELYKECMGLKKENGLLNCRLLGVNELARLLQEKTEAVDTVKDKNKRLELAVVRLENRCSNMEKKSKTQITSSISLPSTTNKGQQQGQGQGQNPFIPGPSKQILETLMRENTDLKKTLDNMTKKGPTGYREAVKMNQLEEVIDQKNEKIEMLNGQLQSLTASASQNNGESGGGIDIGTLQRQLLKMEHSMKVKDRFCTLLSERVNQLQRELNKRGMDDYVDSGFESNKQDVSLDTLTKEHAVKERNMRRLIDDLQHQVEKEREDKMDAITQAEGNRQKLMEKQNDIETLQSKHDDSILYTESLLNEKMILMKQLEDMMNKTNSDPKDPSSSRSDFQREIQNKNMQIDQLKRLLEEAQYKYALAESKHVDFERIEELEDKVKDLEEERSALENENFDTKKRIQDLMQQNTRLRFGNLGAHTPYMLKSGGSPSLDLRSHHGEDVIADSSKSLHDTIKETMRHEVPPLNSRDVGTDGTDATSASPPTPTYTTPDTTSSNRTLHSSSINPIPSSVSSSSLRGGSYRSNVPSTPIMTPHVYPGGSQVMGNSGTGGVVYQQDMMTPRHIYQQQPNDASLYQTHSGTPLSGYAPHFSTGGMHFGGGGGGPGTNRGMGIPMQRSMSSSPGTYGGFPIHSSSVPTTNGAMFGQQPYNSVGSIFGGGVGGGYVTTPTPYVPQYPPTQPGQRYDISQHYGGSGIYSNPYGNIPPPTASSSSQGVTNPTSGVGYSTSPQPPPPQGGQGGLPPSSGQMQRRHSPPDPR